MYRSKLMELIRVRSPKFALPNSREAKQARGERDEFLRSLSQKALETEYRRLYPEKKQ